MFKCAALFYLQCVHTEYMCEQIRVWMSGQPAGGGDARARSKNSSHAEETSMGAVPGAPRNEDCGMRSGGPSYCRGLSRGSIGLRFFLLPPNKSCLRAVFMFSAGDALRVPHWIEL